MADPTADLRQQLADHEADKDKRDTTCFSNLGDCRGLSKEARRWNSRNQDSSQLTVCMGCRLCQNTKTDDIYKNAWCLRKSPDILFDYHVIYVNGHGICAIGLGICVNSHPRSKPPPSL